MARIEFYREPTGPAATRVAVAVFAVTRNAHGSVLLVRRADNGNWEPPGGHVDPGESLVDTLERETTEECGVTVKARSVAGVYTDPDLVLVYPATGEARQQVAVYFHADLVDGAPTPDGDETSEANWFSPDELGSIPMHRVARGRLQQMLLDPVSAHFG